MHMHNFNLLVILVAAISYRRRLYLVFTDPLRQALDARDGLRSE